MGKREPVPALPVGIFSGFELRFSQVCRGESVGGGSAQERSLSSSAAPLGFPLSGTHIAYAGVIRHPLPDAPHPQKRRANCTYFANVKADFVSTDTDFEFRRSYIREALR